jgi:hypothetical protein
LAAIALLWGFGALFYAVQTNAGGIPVVAYVCAILSFLVFAFNFVMIRSQRSTVMIVGPLLGIIAVIELSESMPVRIAFIVFMFAVDLVILPYVSRHRSANR